MARETTAGPSSFSLTSALLDLLLYFRTQGSKSIHGKQIRSSSVVFCAAAELLQRQAPFRVDYWV